MAGLKTRLLLILPVIAFLAWSGIQLRHGRPGAWHGRCVSLWERQDWRGLCDLARNLELLGTPDAETEYYAALAAVQLGEPSAAEETARKWARRKALNLKWEQDLSAVARQRSLLEQVRLYRARITTGLLLLLIPLNLLSIRKPAWSAIGSLLAVLGMLLLAL